MTRRPSHKFLACVLLLSGCQTGNSLLPWQAASEPRYTAEELAQRNNPQPAAARPQLAQSMQSKSASSNSSNDIVAAAPPIAAGRVDQLIKSGRAAILEAGQGDTTKLDEARQIFTQVLTVDNENSSAHHGMAIVADLQNDWSAAELHYKQALQQRPEDPSLLNDLGYSYLLQDRFFEASKYLNQAVQVSPQNERAHINLALLSLKRGDRNAAKSQLASIYSASEINNTLAKLEQDLNQSNPTGGTQVAATPPQYGASQNGNAQQPAMQPFQQPMQSFAGQQPQTGQPADNHGMMAHANRPVSVYPPGVGPAITPQQNFGKSTNPGNSPGNNFGNGNGSDQTAGQFLQFASNGNPPQQGVPVGGVINSPNTGARPNGFQTAQSNMGGNQSQYASHNNVGNGAWPQQNQNGQPLIAGSTRGGMPNAGSAVDHSLQAPIAGLNAGPGTLFPLGINHAPMNSQPSPQQPQQQQFSQMPMAQNGMQNFGGQPMHSQYSPPQGQSQSPQGNQVYQASANAPARDNRPISVLPSEMPQQQQQGNFYPRNMSPHPQQIAPVSATQYLNQPQYGAPQQTGGMASPNGPGPQPGGAPNFQYQNNAPQQQMNMQPQPNAQQYQSFNGGAAPGSPAARMQAYDAQLQQNNNAYNQAVQQMNGQRAAFGNAQGQY